MPRACAAPSALATWRMIRSASRDRERADACEPLIERLALEQLHHDVRAAVGVVAEVEDLDDARIRDRGRRARLVEEARARSRAASRTRVQHLDRGAAAEHRVLGELDRPHAALADRF